MKKKIASLLFSTLALLLICNFATAQENAPPKESPKVDGTRGSTTGPARSPGFSHPNQYMMTNPSPKIPPYKIIAKNMEPVISNESQDAEAANKLSAWKAANKRDFPNILIFLVDDVGWLDVGFNGGGVAVGNPTPNVDKRAHKGLILTSAYSTPSCSPTRATIHTGQNPLHHGVLRPPMYQESGGLNPKAKTLPSILKQLGYRTQGVGKWHMGASEGSLPYDHGYDDYYGFLHVSDMYSEWRDVYFNPEIAWSPERFNYMNNNKLFEHYNMHLTIDQNGNKQKKPTFEIDLQTIKTLDQKWAGYSKTFIKSMKDKDQPWFLYHATRACHFDNYPNDDPDKGKVYAGKSPARTVYSDSVVEFDEIFGELIETLEQTNQLEKTLIIFTSDNGPEDEIPPHGRTPFRGSKGSSWEGGVRVPTFVYWKDMIESRKSDGLFDLADIFNTVLSLAGVKGAEINKYIPDNGNGKNSDNGDDCCKKSPEISSYIDGVDQTSFLLASDGQSNRYSRIYTMNEYFSGVRIDEFKVNLVVQLENLISPRGYPGGFSGPIISETGGSILYNLYTDPREEVIQGIRHIPIAEAINDEIKRYYRVLKHYPPVKPSVSW